MPKGTWNIWPRILRWGGYLGLPCQALNGIRRVLLGGRLHIAELGLPPKQEEAQVVGMAAEARVTQGRSHEPRNRNPPAVQEILV